MSYLLDTDTVSHALRGEGGVAARIRSARSDLAVSALTVAEIEFGLHKRSSRKMRTLFEDFRSGVRVLPFDEAAAKIFGRLTATLHRAGSPIGEIDTLIAAHAIASSRVLVSNNTGEFSRVPGLRLENWY